MPGQVGQPLQSLAAGSLSAVQPGANPAAPRSMAGGGQISCSGRPQQPSDVDDGLAAAPGMQTVSGATSAGAAGTVR